MTSRPRPTRKLQPITLDGWDRRYEQLISAGLAEPAYGGSLRRHLNDGDRRLEHLLYDDSAAALRLWNFLLTEEDRLHDARRNGKKLVGAMKDLGTVPIMAYSLPDVIAFYPDGAWWIPCVMELDAGLLEIADSLGIDETFCPVRAVLGAFLTEAHFPIPDLLTCSVGAVCDDFSAIAQRLNGLGYPILWWEIPHRRTPEEGEEAVTLPGGFVAPAAQVEFVKTQLQAVREAIEQLAGEPLDDVKLADGIAVANRIRKLLARLRRQVFTAPICPMPALEMLIAEMLAIHYCSDRDECINVLEDLLKEVESRTAAGIGYLDADAVRLFWVNPVADMRVMNLVEECGARICGTDNLFFHALDEIPQDIPPMDALAMTALADAMVGPAGDRASRICRDIEEFGCEGVVISRIPGASHCAIEGGIIADMIESTLRLPVIELEVPPVADSMYPALRNRVEGLVEIVKESRRS